MKTFRFSFVLVCCLFASSFAFAADSGGLNPQTQLRKEVAKLIHTPELSKNGIAETQAFINFTINEDNEIVVLNVIADNEYIKDYVTRSLNKRKINADGLEAFTEYNIKVAFRSEKA